VNEAYEKAVKDYAGAAIGSDTFMRAFWSDIKSFVETGFVNSLTQILLKLTAPGVPDIYQGTEAADMSLVDPDNRRMPDYQQLMRTDEEPNSSFAAAKASLVRTALALRNRHPELFAFGDYIPLETTGRRRDNVLGFARRHGRQAAITVVPRLVHEAVAWGALLSPAYWGDTAIRVPDDVRSVRDASDAKLRRAADGSLRIADIYDARPFALLIAED
jgi:(1->4)-alpha-D-glucan 1-alpha-D-glucosylmutase